MDSVKHHSALYRELQKDENLCNKIKLLLEGRVFFLNLLKKYIAHLSKRGNGHLKVLEEGYGTALNSCVLKKEYPSLDFYAIDLSVEAIELAGLTPILNISSKCFFLLRIFLGKPLRKRFCRDLVAVFEK